MTCIAYRDGILAAESRVWVHSEDGGARFFDTSKKLFRLYEGTSKECIVATAGESLPSNQFLAWYGSGKRPPAKLRAATGYHILVLDRKGMWEYDEQLEPESVDGPYYAIGTGCKAALGCMFKGGTAEEAVAAACSCDPYCGGPIVTMRLE